MRWCEVTTRPARAEHAGDRRLRGRPREAQRLLLLGGEAASGGPARAVVAHHRELLFQQRGQRDHQRWGMSVALRSRHAAADGGAVRSWRVFGHSEHVRPGHEQAGVAGFEAARESEE